MTSITCTPSQFSLYLFIFGWSFLMMIVGGVAGYIFRHKNDKRKFHTVTFMGEMLISVFVGMIVLCLSIYWDQLQLKGDSWEQVRKTGLVCVLMGMGAMFSPLIISIIENKIREKFPVMIDAAISVMKGKAEK